MYTRKTDEEIKKLAQDIIAGQVYGSWDVADGSMMQMVFMPLVFMDRQHLEQMEKEEITACYEYIHKAGPRSVNGMPSFMSMSMLNKEDNDRLYEWVMKLRSALEAVLNPGGKDGKEEV